MKTALLVVLLLPATVVAAPKSIMVDAPSILVGQEPYVVRTWMNTICENHRTPGSDDFIHNLVVMEIGRRVYNDQTGRWEYVGDADTAVLDTEALDILEDYYGCFDNVFIGTANMYGSNPYAPGGDMHDADYRWNSIIYPSERLAEAYAARFAQKFPGGVFHWYISYEANLNYFTDATLRAEYAAVFLELIDDFHRIRPGTAVLWSPNFWTYYASMGTTARNQLAAALTDFFSRPETDGLDWVHFQDFVGASSFHDCAAGGVGYYLDTSNAIGYHGLMNQAAGAHIGSLRVNMELFMSGLGACGAFTCCVPGDADEHARRESDYQAAGVPVGASFELRYWYASLYGQAGQECNQAEVCNGQDDDCDRRVDEDIAPRGCGVDTGECSPGTEPCVNGTWGPCSGVPPADEICNGLDDDCDGETDEGCEVDGGPPDAGQDASDAGYDASDAGQDASDAGRDAAPDGSGDRPSDPGAEEADGGCGCGGVHHPGVSQGGGDEPAAPVLVVLFALFCGQRRRAGPAI